jgi:hypothetical protein
MSVDHDPLAPNDEDVEDRQHRRMTTGTAMDRMERIEQALKRIEESVARLLQLGEEARQEWLSIRQVAAITGLSGSHIRRAVKSVELLASNAGTPDRPAWRIARADLADWMRKRMGGTVFPPIAGTVSVGKKSRHFDD